ncbi:ABC transporter ATP-binding protein [Marinicrinis lubricantis]|uniref:ABC transporter ATP-binding protein n=1 Tax=Marinicrinis lubricantis TaxID=2086470 RepID=A0ABW1IQK9_9BACL
MAMVEATGLMKRYGNVISVDHLSLTIQKGEIFGLLGPNGAGKSTTISMLAGLLKPDQGEIRIGGASVSKQPLEVKRQIGIVPQDIAVYSNLTAKENVTFFAKLYGLRGDELKKAVEESLDFVGLSDRSHDHASTFSGGMKRRLNIACAITHRPKLLIMDEPTVGIDPQSRNHILQSVKALNERGSTIIYTSHYMEEVEAICSRIAIMDHGRLIAQGTKSELVDQLKEEEKIVVLTEKVNHEAVQELRQHPRIFKVDQNGEELTLYLHTSQAHLQDILFILSKHDVRIRSLNRIEPDLESVFLSLTGRTLRD